VSTVNPATGMVKSSGTITPTVICTKSEAMTLLGFPSPTVTLPSPITPARFDGCASARSAMRSTSRAACRVTVLVAPRATVSVVCPESATATVIAPRESV